MINRKNMFYENQESPHHLSRGPTALEELAGGVPDGGDGLDRAPGAAASRGGCEELRGRGVRVRVIVEGRGSETPCLQRGGGDPRGWRPGVGRGGQAC